MYHRCCRELPLRAAVPQGLKTILLGRRAQRGLCVLGAAGTLFWLRAGVPVWSVMLDSAREVRWIGF